MRNPDFDPFLRIKKDKLKRSIRFKAYKRRILSKLNMFQTHVDWWLVLRIVILAILLASVATFFALIHIADVKIQNINKNLDHIEKLLEENKQDKDKMLKDLDEQIKQLEKEDKETRKLIMQKKNQQPKYYASTPYVAPVNNPTVEAYLLSKFSPSGSYNAKVMLAVCKAESGLRNVDNGVGDMGVCQIRLSAHWAIVPGNNYDQKKASLLNPYINIDLAWQISNRGTNFWPWTDYKNGKYLRYI